MSIQSKVEKFSSIKLTRIEKGVYSGSIESNGDLWKLGEFVIEGDEVVFIPEHTAYDFGELDAITTAVKTWNKELEKARKKNKEYRRAQERKHLDRYSDASGAQYSDSII